MCRSVDYPPHSQIHSNGYKDSLIFTDFDFDGFVQIKENIALDKKTMSIANTRNIKHKTNKLKLQDIPEETELHLDIDARVDSNPELEEACNHLETDLQVLRRSLDMGIWVLCLGVGYMVSTKFRPRTKFSSLLSSSFL